MKINKNSLSTRFYTWTYGISKNQLPTNFCAYFWLWVSALLFLPVTFFSAIIQFSFIGRKMDLSENETWSFSGRCGIFFLLLTALMCLTAVSILLAVSPALTVSILLLIAVLVLFCYLHSNKKFPLKDTEVFNIVREKIKSVKEGYCPKIEYYED